MCFHMCTKSPCLRERLITNRASIRLFPGMNPHVDLKRRSLIESFITDSTNMISISCMSLDMNLQILRPRKRLRAVTTVIGLFPRMNPHVFFQLGGSDAPPVADGADVRLFTTMGTLMYS